MTKREQRAKRTIRRRVVNVILILGIVMLYTFVSYLDTHYTKDATIIHTSNNYYAVAVDDAGNEWEFCADNVFVNQKVKLKMHTNNTNSIYDDKVVGVKIIAEVE